MSRFLEGVPESHVLDRLRRAGGNEVESGKIDSPQSSAALAVNAFGWFIPRPERFPLFGRGVGARSVEVEYQARFPWSGGRHPWLDAAIVTGNELVGVESKRFEPFRDKKKVALSEAYDRPKWGGRMGPFESVRDALRSGSLRFLDLDAGQLVKHAFGLRTEALRLGLAPRLVYMFAEPPTVPSDALERHRHEIEQFAEKVAGAEVTFGATSYREWIASWAGLGSDLAAHGQAVRKRFDP